MAEFNWGIIGPGRIAHKFADAIHQLKGSNLYAVASRSSKNLNALRKDFQSSKAYGSYDELVSDPEVQAVYIATPHRFHFENAKLCLSKGKSVLIEKPITVNRSELQHLVELSMENNLFLMEAMWTRFLPVFRKIREWINADEIGEPRLVTSSFGFHAKRNAEDRWLNLQLAGGAVLDLSVYNVAATQMVFGMIPERITADAFIGPTGVDELVNVGLDYGSGRSARFMSTLLSRPFTALQIWGTIGNIITEAPFNSSEKVTLFNDSGETVFEQKHRINGFEYQIEEAQRCIEAGLIESPLMTNKDSLDDLYIMDEVRKQIGLRYPFENQ
jgi:predicted dehydrogenase